MGKTLLASMNMTALLASLILLSWCGTGLATRLKDVADVQGVRPNQLIGYGLVVGLNGSGDGTQAQFTIQSIVNMLERMGINVDPKQVKVKNVASVMVTADMPPFAKIGQKIDVVVSSLGDAKSLQGGTLLLTPLKGADGKVYAMAQGPLSIGGFAAGGGGASVQKNHPTAGRIPNGATIEREIPLSLNAKKQIHISLRNPDFTTVVRAVDAVNQLVGQKVAFPLDAETFVVNVPRRYKGNVVGLLAAIENCEINPDHKAEVVLDERTGTVVIGADVRLSPVAIAHGNLSIKITNNPEVSQPAPFGQGQTVVTPNTQVEAEEQKARLLSIPAQNTIGDLVSALNAIGVTPRDLISILQSIKAAGALRAELKVI